MAGNEDRRDLNTLAARIVGESIDEDREPESDKARAGRKGGRKGGPARAKKLTPEQRQKSARKAAQARWSRP